MLFRATVIKQNVPLPICIAGISTDKYENPLLAFSRAHWGRKSYMILANTFLKGYYGCRYCWNIAEVTILWGVGFIAVEQGEGIDVILYKIGDTLYVDSEFKTKYPKLYTNLRRVIIKPHSEAGLPIVTKPTCGDDIFEVFEKPKFKNIKERQVFFKELVEEVNK